MESVATPRVSVSTFVDYLVSPGNKRLQLVSRQVEQYGELYNPASDFYRPMLNALRADLRMGGGTQNMDDAVRNARGTRAAHFPEVSAGLAGYARRAQREGAAFNVAPKADWLQPEVRVNVNPDFVLTRAGGTPEIVKVYFKPTPISRFAASAAIRLMELSGAVDTVPDGVPCVLDARRGKVFKPQAKVASDLNAYLESEALAFGRLWRGIAA